MSSKDPKTRHEVLSGRDFNFFRDLERSKAEEVMRALEERFPSSPADFMFKLLPLSVGACLLIICESSPKNTKGHKHRRQDRTNCEVIESELMRLDVEEVLAVAEGLVKRWHASQPPEAVEATSERLGR